MLLNFIIALTLIVIVMYYAVPSCQNLLERFQNAPGDVVVYTTNQLNYNTWIAISGENKWAVQNMTLTATDAIYNHLQTQKRFPSDILPSASQVMWIGSEMDAVRYLKPASKDQAIAWKDAYFVALGIPEEMFHMECAFNLAGKTIGYLDRIDKHFIQCILLAYRIPLSDVRLVAIPLTEWSDLNRSIRKHNLHMIVTHIVPQNPLHIMIKSQYLSIVGWGRMDIDRIAVFNPYLTKEEVDLKGMFMSGDRKTTALVMDREKRGPVVKVKIGMFALNGQTTPPTIESFITRLFVSDDVYDPAYKCYGDISIEQKALCVSPYNQQGDPKRIQTKWDRPCIKNEDCPFYKANKNYANTRGGCLKGGVCEMPTGVLRTAYRMYDATGVYSPFCYGCDDPGDIACCAKQSKPDYAFPNDTKDREKAGLATFVSIV